jgi:rfaE bifunctional protein kinase chain/domain
MKQPRVDVERLKGRKVVVIGDVMLDEFARGDVRRISPEAPVPVLEVTVRAHALGGAANAAANVASLGGKATLLGVVGDDASAGVLDAMLAERGIRSMLVRDASRPTTHKTRLVARGQQIVRIDQESRAEADGDVRTRLLASVVEALSDADACILSDYAKGAVSAELARAVVDAAGARGIPVVADPKRRDFAFYRGVSVVTPNHAELELAVGRPVLGDEIEQAASELLSVLGGAALLATRGADGMTLFQTGAPPFHVDAAKRSVFDVTGAGDTVVATLATVLAAGDELRNAVVAASAAAGVVVSKDGTASVSPTELDEALRDEEAF